MSDSKVTRIGRLRPPRLYIQEWMDKKGLTQADIAGRLEVGSSGTISKKLAKPEKLSAEWLAKFAWSLDLESVSQLYDHPERPSRDDLLLKGVPENDKPAFIRDINALKRARYGS